MSRFTNISLEKRGEIIGMFKANKSIKEISQEAEVAINTVRLWIKRYNEEYSLVTKSRPGRPRATTATQDREMVNYIKGQPFETAKSLLANLNLSCSYTTVRRRLKNEGLNSSKPAKTEALTEKHRTARIQFARNFLNADWSKTIFTDEKVFSSDTLAPKKVNNFIFFSLSLLYVTKSENQFHSKILSLIIFKVFIREDNIYLNLNRALFGKSINGIFFQSNILLF